MSTRPKQEKTVMEEEWEVGETAEIKLEIVNLNENGMETGSQEVDSMHILSVPIENPFQINKSSEN